MKYKNITLTTLDDIFTLTLNRPERRNALTEELMIEVITACNEINASDSARVVIIRGAGKDFCSGFDLKHFDETVSPEDIRRIVSIGPNFKNAIINLRPITIACIEGNCVGGGVVVAFACDFKYATSDSQFWLPEARLGIPMAFGSIPMLNESLSKSKAMEFILLGNKLSASELHQFGVLNGVGSRLERDEKVHATSRALSELPRFVAETTKRQLVAARDGWTRSPYEFTDASLLFSGLMDEEGKRARRRLVSDIRNRRIKLK